MSETIPETFRVLLLGKGGREHALAWRLGQSSKVTAIYVCPGNAATCNLAKTFNADIPQEDSGFSTVLEFVREKELNFVVPSQEQHLAAGIVDACRQACIACLGPTRQAAKLESSKAFSKNFMVRHDISTADFAQFENLKDANVYLHYKFLSDNSKLVIKASGMTGGRGVVILDCMEEAIACLSRFKQGEFGHVSHRNPIIVEKFLDGVEFSVVALTDGKTCKAFPPLRDYKRRLDGDTGPNTGGMGCVCPLPGYNTSQLDDIVRQFFLPTLNGMETEGCSISGVLCIDFIQTTSALYAIEFDTRFGDPELQALLPLICEKTDLAELLFSTTTQLLHTIDMCLYDFVSLAVVVVKESYPASDAGEPTEIRFRESIDSDVMLFHSGTSIRNGTLLASGGRVFTVTCLGSSRHMVARKIYKAIEQIEFEGKEFRIDIGDSMTF